MTESLPPFGGIRSFSQNGRRVSRFAQWFQRFSNGFHVRVVFSGLITYIFRSKFLFYRSKSKFFLSKFEFCISNFGIYSSKSAFPISKISFSISNLQLDWLIFCVRFVQKMRTAGKLVNSIDYKGLFSGGNTYLQRNWIPPCRPGSCLAAYALAGRRKSGYQKSAI